ncbi:hypothetical protein ABI59_11910 [Acidobacteria bacterium Mor1]|nr:hypothetical protein ABI59_11910 [Acidobacteria bacterium Mor1]
MHAVLYVQAAATLFMTGLIWFVQWVHYPLFARVGSGFEAYQVEHMRRTGFVVGPPMLAEAAAAGWIALFPPPGVPRGAALAGLGLLAAIWISTWLSQVPSHRRLLQSFDETAHRRLVRSNWVRTLAWTLRSLVALWMVVQAS